MDHPASHYRGPVASLGTSARDVTGHSMPPCAAPLQWCCSLFSCGGTKVWRCEAWCGPSPSYRRRLAAKAEALDDAAVARDLGLLQVVEQPAALADQEQQTTTTVVVVLVLLQVLGEVGGQPRQQGDLNLGGTRVAVAS